MLKAESNLRNERTPALRELVVAGSVEASLDSRLPDLRFNRGLKWIPNIVSQAFTTRPLFQYDICIICFKFYFHHIFIKIRTQHCLPGNQYSNQFMNLSYKRWIRFSINDFLFLKIVLFWLTNILVTPKLQFINCLLMFKKYLDWKLTTFNCSCNKKQWPTYCRPTLVNGQLIVWHLVLWHLKVWIICSSLGHR